MRQLLNRIFACVTLCCFVVATQAQTQQQTVARIKLDTDRTIGEVNPLQLVRWP